MIRSVRAVAFDLDATLCEYTLTVQEVIERALARIGLSGPPFGRPAQLAAEYNVAWWTAEEHLRVPVHELRRRAWTTLLKRRGFDDRVAARRLADAYSEIRDESGVRLFDGVASFLCDLRNRFRIGILTNGPSDMQWDKLRRLHLPDAVDGIIVAGDLGVFKPDSRPFRRLLRTLEAQPPTSLFVGDSYEHDIVGARAIGMQTAWVTKDGRPEDGGPSPDHVVERATDLRGVLL